MDFEFQDSKSRLREFQGSHKKVEKVNIGENRFLTGNKPRHQCNGQTFWFIILQPTNTRILSCENPYLLSLCQFENMELEFSFDENALCNQIIC